MDSILTKYIRHFIFLTIPGAFYLLAAYLLFLKLSNYLPIDYEVLIKSLTFVQAVIIGIFSYVVGMVSYLAEETILHIIIPKFKKEQDKVKDRSDPDRVNISEKYAIMIMLRHIVYSNLIICLILHISKNIDDKLVCSVTVIQWIFIFILILAYLKIRNVYKKNINEPIAKTNS